MMYLLQKKIQKDFPVVPTGESLETKTHPPWAPRLGSLNPICHYEKPAFLGGRQMPCSRGPETDRTSPNHQLL